MSLVINLLGRPAITRNGISGYQFRSRKSWALLAYLILSERAPARVTVATMLFDEADDPLRALRWNLSEIRRALGDDVDLSGDPLTIRLPDDAVVDVVVVARGRWAEAVRLAGLGSDLLETVTVRGAAGFESWLLAEQRRLAASSEAILHEAALGSASRGELSAALGFAVRAATMSPLDENHQALLIRLYRQAGDDRAAERQYEACKETFERELGVQPGPAIVSALRETRKPSPDAADGASIDAIVEAGAAAVSAGATEAGVASLRTAVRLADTTDDGRLRVGSRLALAEALIHSLRGFDEEGLTILHAADEIATAQGDNAARAAVRSELGYVDFLRARYDRAELWLTDALAFADGSPWILAKATTYLGAVESDRAEYVRSLDLLDEAIRLSRAAGDVRRETYAVSMLGRIHLLRGDLDAAAARLDVAIELSERDHWLSFLPWPQAMRGEVELARGDRDAAAGFLEHAFARACQLGDPCWEGMAARGLALVADADGDTERAFELLADARSRCNRLADPYVWLDAYILDAQCELGRRHGHPGTVDWVESMQRLASRTAMREMIVRSLLHGAAIGMNDAAAAALLLAGTIDNPVLQALATGVRG